jgi:hypothetical protein
MKNIIAAILLLGPSLVSADEVILPYSAFGPQASAYELIGMEWWQWDPHGDSRQREYPIKVVVFWNQSREYTAKRYPVDPGKLQDFRYLEYTKAVTHMENTIKEFKDAALDSSSIEQGLAKLKLQKAEQVTTRRKNTGDRPRLIQQ